MARALAALALLLLAAAALIAPSPSLAASQQKGRVRHRRQVTIPAAEDAVKQEVVTVLGDVVNGADHVCYVAYKGIAYAKPPVGDLRFKNPEPHLAQQRRSKGSDPKCAQIVVPGGNLETTEDCLYLNVYTPFGDRLADLPVMVYIHGGGYVYGSATQTENGPDFLVRHGVILVTINYRLGAFGFLNLDNDDIPGNMGLKDQQAALKWVQTYIAYFGGDPSKVTIFGNSAGAASVHYQTIAPSSRGLFRAAIMQSGNALASFAYNENHLTRAQQLSEQLGSKTADPKQMAAAFRNASTLDILNANLRMIQTDPILKLGSPAFCPSPERRRRGTQEKFLPQDPEALERSYEGAHVPTIVGLTGQEGYFATYLSGLNKQPETMAALAQNPALLLSPNVAPYPDTARLLGVRGDGGNYTVTVSPEQAGAIGAKLTQEYQLAAANNGDFIPLFGDLFTASATHRLAQLRLRRDDAPLYMYHFLEDGDYNWGKVSFGITETGATTHTDELGYLMHITSPRDLQQTARGSSSSSKALNLLTTLWTDFAKYATVVHHDWPQAEGSALDAPYAQITDQVAVGRGLGGERMRLWEDVYGELRGELPVDKSTPQSSSA